MIEMYSSQTEAIEAYKREHYDQVKVYVGKGARAQIKALAYASGMTVSEYIRHLIIKDAKQRGIDLNTCIGGGGGDPVTAAIALGQLSAPWA